jgi:hypothetical protein
VTVGFTHKDKYLFVHEEDSYFPKHFDKNIFILMIRSIILPGTFGVGKEPMYSDKIIEFFFFLSQSVGNLGQVSSLWRVSILLMCKRTTKAT